RQIVDPGPKARRLAVREHDAVDPALARSGGGLCLRARRGQREDEPNCSNNAGETFHLPLPYRSLTNDDVRIAAKNGGQPGQTVSSARPSSRDFTGAYPSCWRALSMRIVHSCELTQ